MAQVERFLVELGAGFAFVGQRWRLDLDGNEFFIDLLMFHIPTNRYVVLELKTTKLTPADGEVPLEHYAPTVGLLLCPTRIERTSAVGSSQPRSMHTAITADVTPRSSTRRSAERVLVVPVAADVVGDEPGRATRRRRR